MQSKTNSTPQLFESLLERLRIDHSSIAFSQADNFYWSPKNQTVYINPDKQDLTTSCWSVLHELSHALLGHKSYESDLELLMLEVEAWEHAKKLAVNYNIDIDENHIQDCLDTYRDWLHHRSRCTDCAMNGIQIDSSTYKCTHCRASWRVSVARFCRPYRKRIKN